MFFKLPLKPLPVALIGLGVHTKDCTSPDCTLSINILDLKNFSWSDETLGCSPSLDSYWQHQLETAPWILSWSAENIILNNNSEFVDSALRRMDVFPLFCRRIPRLKALILVKTWCLVSLRFCTIFAAKEFHFHSGLQFLVPYHLISSPSPINVQWPCGNCCAYNFTLSEFEIQVFVNISLFLFNVVEHWHECDPVRESFWFHVLASQVFLDLL